MPCDRVMGRLSDTLYLQFDPDKPFSAVVDYLNRKLKDKIQDNNLVSPDCVLHLSTITIFSPSFAKILCAYVVYLHPSVLSTP